MTRRSGICTPEDHAASRRQFLGAAAASGITAFGAQASALAGELKKQGKSVIMLWLAGGASQLETFDPKPGAVTGGPFRSIQTSTAGVRISELMPKLAKRLHDTCIIRSLNTKNADHGGGADLMMRGRRDDASLRFPDLGAVLARELGASDSKVPDYVSFYLQTEGRNFAGSGFLGARFGPMQLSQGMTPENLSKPDNISASDFADRMALRDSWSRAFEQGRISSSLGSHQQA
ncbi:MAG: DUF1501 domain-containing protein, partial [Planctomycetota bacterium]